MSDTIANTTPLLEELYITLDQAYWEANSLSAKDAIYNIISGLNSELSELNKLSIQDHDLEYEPISPQFKEVLHKLSPLLKVIDEKVLRSSTAHKLEIVIFKTLNLIKKKTKNH